MSLQGVLRAALAADSSKKLISHRGSVAISGPAISLAIAALAKSRDSKKVGPVWAIVSTEYEAEKLRQSVLDFAPNLKAIVLPAWETLPHERLSPSAEIVGRRLQALHILAQPSSRTNDQSVDLVLLSVRAAMQKIILAATERKPIRLDTAEDFFLPELILKLIEFGYERVDLVTRRGEIAVRGGILDIFPSTASHAVRLEFFGDRVEEIREFSVADQRSIASLTGELAIFPARELLITPDVAQRAREMLHEFPNLSDLLEKISEGIPVPGMEALASALGQKLVTVMSFVSQASKIVLVNPALLESHAKSLVETNSEFLHAAWDAAFEGAAAPLDFSQGDYLHWDELTAEFARSDIPLLEFSPLVSDGDNSLRPDWREIPKFTSIEHSCDWIIEQLAAGRSIALVAGAEGTAQRIAEILQAKGISAALSSEVGTSSGPSVAIVLGSVGEGLVLRDANLLYLSDFQFLVRSAESTNSAPRKLAAKRGVRVDPLSLKRGDFVVHEIHGVGRFLELVQREIGVGLSRQLREYLVIEYASPRRGYPADTLFVPTDALDLVTLYVGSDEPSLSKMGGTDWAKAKNGARKAVRKLAVDLVKLYSQRMKAKGFAFSPDTQWQRELESAFPFRETPDQLVTIEEIKRDMERGIPMDRLLAGDVGFGKTEVAVRAAFKAVQDGKQVAVLVPTTLLVRQHTETFRNRFSGFPVSVKPLSRFQTSAEAADTLRGIKTGAVDVVIGTHRLLSEKIEFKDLGLLIIDEEQRFGVEHKERIKALRENVDVLSMSATPIPRTLEMAVTGIREMSTLATPPEERQPVLTYVGGYSEGQVAAAIRRELIREGQVFFVHNRVENIAAVAKRIQELVPQARVGVAHGQLPESELERVVVDFWERKFDVLVSTTIVEAGLDIPNANTLIVDRAERFGLSQLHQIRGRVGRGKERAYAYFFYDPSLPLTSTAHDRLATIATNSELGGGMQIALKDLELRGAGNLLGGEQSGHIAGVGFDLYLRMVGEAVAEFRGEAIAKPAELRLELPIDARIPDNYIDSERLRLEIYQKVAAAASIAAREEDLTEVKREIIDRYGDLPQPVLNLLRAAELRRLAAQLRLTEVNLLGTVARISPTVLTDSALVSLSSKLAGVKYLKSSHLLTVQLPKWKSVGDGYASEVMDFAETTLKILGHFLAETEPLQSHS